MSAASPALAPGRAHPLGAHLVDGGVNFALWSDHAEAIELSCFDARGEHETARHRLVRGEDGMHSGFLPGAGAGLIYGYRAHGPWAPQQGHRYNPHKLLLDPWAREILGRFHWDDRHHDHVPGHPDGLLAFDARDNADIALKARVAAPRPSAARPALRPTADVVLYEVHVKGYSMRMPGIPEALRGSYAALAHPASIAHLHRLGVTTLCLLPVHYSLSERNLARAGLVNYWGYNTLGYFAPDPRLATREHAHDPAAVAAEFRQMVEALHAAGFEVVLDVVYNHTAEGDAGGPTLAFRGLDAAAWYRHEGDGRLIDWSGCGNTLNLAHPRVAQFVLDSLRWWVSAMGVDGFRFDLATILGRTRQRFDPDAPFLVALRQDPLLAALRLIAEPWDNGPDGWQVGRFPGTFLDWNDRFRDAARGYWLREVPRGEFARRLLGSSDLFHHGHRRPTASVNFVAAHDGRTLADVLAYAHKHNHANGEQGRDGRDDEIACNFGIEGPADDPAIVALRRRVRHALLATLLLAQGTPMLLAGDETGNSQRGNNNAYCQDNPVGWLDWAPGEDETTRLVAALTALRRAEPLLRHPEWFAGPDAAGGAAVVHWRAPAGHLMQVADWHAVAPRAFACELIAAGARSPRLALLFNPESQPMPFALAGAGWRLALDSSGERLLVGAAAAPLTDSTLVAPARSLLVLLRDACEDHRP
jgi:glycogen operon protein